MIRTRIFKNPDAKKFSVRTFERDGTQTWYVRLWYFCVVIHPESISDGG